MLLTEVPSTARAEDACWYRDRMATRRALISSTVERAYHFEGVPAALRSRGLEAMLECSQTQAPTRVPRWLAETAEVVLHAESLAGHAASARLSSRAAGVPCVALMDGICDFANTFLNPIPGPPLLRPAPGDVVLASGVHDRGILRALGNRAVATGLPRLEAFHARWHRRPTQQPDTDVLIATANTPAVTPGGGQRMLDTLRALRDACQRTGIRAIWRTTNDFANALGVPNEDGQLIDALARVRAVVTSASTLAIEGMLAGRPVGILHPHPWPLWLPAAWRFDGDARAGWSVDLERAKRFEGVAARANRRASSSVRAVLGDRIMRPIHSVAGFLASVLEPNDERLQAQARALHTLHKTDASERIVRVLDATTRLQIASPTARVGSRRQPTGSLRVTSMIEAHQSSVGGVSVWSERMERYFASHPEHGIEWRTLFIGSCTPPEHERINGRARAWSVEFDPTDSLVAQLNSVRSALAETDVLLPNYSELAHRVASLERARGVRVLAIAHTNDRTTRELFRSFPGFDAAVGVSESCAEWLRQDHAVPVETVVYGVPVDEQPVMNEAGQPIRIVSVGRVVQEQKCVFDLIDVLCSLKKRGVAFHFTLVGDGKDLSAWQRLASKAGLDPNHLSILGAIPPSHVIDTLASQDISLNVSEAEGTSIAMLEAMGSGLVPIVSDVPGVRELIEDGENGFVCTIGQAELFAERIMELSRDRGQLQRMSRIARETIVRNELTISNCAKYYATIVRSMASRPVQSSRRVLDSPNDVWRARGPATAPELRGLFDDQTIQLVHATEAHPGAAAIERLESSGRIVAVEPTLDRHAASHLTHLVEQVVTREGGQVFVAASSARAMPAIEWIARYRSERIEAFVVPGVGGGAMLFGLPAISFESALKEDVPILIAGPPVDSPSFAAACAHGVRADRLRMTSGTVKSDIERIRSVCAGLDGARTVTTLHAGVIPGARSVTPGRAVDTLRSNQSFDTLVLRGDADDFAVATACASSIDRDIRVVSLGWQADELSAPHRFAQIVRGELGEHPYAMYGAGTHTRRLLQNLPRELAKPGWIIDDSADAWFESIPVVRPDAIDAEACPAIVLSSPVHETRMWSRTAALRARGVRVFALYSRHE